MLITVGRDDMLLSFAINRTCRERRAHHLQDMSSDHREMFCEMNLPTSLSQVLHRQT
jgi:hypothetical protein